MLASLLLGLVALPTQISTTQDAPAVDPLAPVLVVAAKENQRILVLLEDSVGERSDDIGKILHGRTLSREILYEYQQLRTTPSSVPTLAKSLPADAMLPQLLLLDSSGKVLARHSWASFVGEEGVDQEAILALLKQYEAKPRDARVWLEQARLQAAAQGKTLFVHLGAPW